jgi:aminoglycoside phosphotransferase (APT) family kinase protein
MSDSPRSQAALTRAVSLAGPDATVRDTIALAGGTHAGTYLIRTAGPEREFVLREFGPGDDAAIREARILAALDGLDGLAPRLLASDPDGSASAGPWTLISRMPGHADIDPADPVSFACQLGTALARIHATAPDRLSVLGHVADRPGGSRAPLNGPAAGLVADSWERLVDQPAVLTHYDFWSGNTVWEGGVLTGVVDWSEAARGPRVFDLGWCRLDLYLLYGQSVADRFLESYQAASTTPCPDLLLADLWAVARSHDSVTSWVPNYSDLGRTDLTAAELGDRHAAWTRHLIERAGHRLADG